jgi:hypothetical protein
MYQIKLEAAKEAKVMNENTILKIAPWTLLVGVWLIGVGGVLSALPITL